MFQMTLEEIHVRAKKLNEIFVFRLLTFVSSISTDENSPLISCAATYEG